MTKSYHDLFVTTSRIPRTAISDLPFGYQVICDRVGGWTLAKGDKAVAGEFGGPGLKLDVAGVVIVDSMKPRRKRTTSERDVTDRAGYALQVVTCPDGHIQKRAMSLDGARNTYCIKCGKVVEPVQATDEEKGGEG